MTVTAFLGWPAWTSLIHPDIGNRPSLAMAKTRREAPTKERLPLCYSQQTLKEQHQNRPTRIVPRVEVMVITTLPPFPIARLLSKTNGWGACSEKRVSKSGVQNRKRMTTKNPKIPETRTLDIMPFPAVVLSTLNQQIKNEKSTNVFTVHLWFLLRCEQKYRSQPLCMLALCYINWSMKLDFGPLMKTIQR